MFYAVDLNRLRSIPGSNDTALLESILANEENSLDDDEQDALKRIITGDIKEEANTEYLYGYALKAICEHIGEMVGGEVAAVRDHPYKSKLVANGSPIQIPISRSDFPEIGYLDRSELEAEHRLATTTKPKAKRTLIGFVLRKATGGVVGRELDAEDIAEDMEEYAETLQECIDKDLSVISFRH